ncbi:MAG: glycine cleavage system aminomethyltransferase GcvT, partial [Chloroflexota bacterium]
RPEIKKLAEAMATVLRGCTPFTYAGMGRRQLLRAKVDFDALQKGRALVGELRGLPEPAAENDTLTIRGEAAADLLNHALTSDVAALAEGQSQPTFLFGPGLEVYGTLRRETAASYHLRLPDAATAQQAAAWLGALSDGYVHFGDLHAKLSGPVAVQTTGEADLPAPVEDAAAFADHKPFFIGHEQRPQAEALPAFTWTEPEEPPLLKTVLHQTHIDSGGRMVPFAGYDMPVWYSSVSEEHTAVRQTAGLFDVTHMGVFDASGPHVVNFLNMVLTNDVSSLAVGQSHYTYLLFPDGSVVDDLLLYRLAPERFMLVVNASNNDKDWAWLNAVNDGEVRVDEKRPFARNPHPITLRDLRDAQHGADCRLDIALQGPLSTKILLGLCDDELLATQIRSLPWAGLVQGSVGGFDLIISRTGYTGERTAYELFVHPDQAVALWQALLQVGEPMGLKPCGLAARDSTRTEAGLPLYGHELAGPLNLMPGDAGFGSYVKLWKPFFVGREAFITAETKRDQELVRFRMDEKGVRRAEQGDPILDKRGKVVGTVTSCAIDSEGYLLGQAIVAPNMTEPGTTLYLYQLGGGTRELRLPAAIKPGVRLPLPDSATVQSRFPSRKRK